LQKVSKVFRVGQVSRTLGDKVFSLYSLPLPM
jgi:hypothetical protein